MAALRCAYNVKAVETDATYKFLTKPIRGGALVYGGESSCRRGSGDINGVILWGVFMAVQRDIWKQTFSVWPRLPCPRCKIGTLKIDRKSITKNETRSSKAERGHEAWDPSWILERFIATMVCTGPTCGEVVSVCGQITSDWFYSYDPDGDVTQEIDEYFNPIFFEPALPLFQIPDECPDEVREELKKAFALFWSDRGSSANRLRVTVEELMNALKIQKKERIKSGKNKGKFRDLSLHERIEKFETKHSVAATQLMAIKWTGNVGSHAVMDKLTHDDLLDAFEHFDYALDLVYVNRSVALEKRAKRIIKKQGPIRTRTKRSRRRRS